MSIPLPLNLNQSLRPFTETELAAIDLKRRGIRADHGHWNATYSPNGSSCTRMFSCAWDQRFNALIHLVGACKTYVDGEQTKISRLLPQTDTVHENWYCTGATISPWRFMQNIVAVEPEDDVPSPEEIEASNPGYVRGMHMPVFGRAEIRATFELNPFALLSDEDTEHEYDRYTTYPGHIGCEISTDPGYVQIPAGSNALHYTNNDGTTRPAGVPIPFATGFTEVQSRTSFLWRRAPFEVYQENTRIWQLVNGNGPANPPYVGAINKTAFQGYDALALLLVGVEPRLLPDPTGMGYSWDIKFNCLHRPTPWGHLGYIYNPGTSPGSGTQGYYQVLRGAAGNTTKAITDLTDTDTLYPLREFRDLWNPSQV